MTYSEVYSDYTSAYYPVDSSATSLSIDDMTSRAWTWQPPNPLPVIHEPPSMRVITAPHISMRLHKPFLGHKFRIGGNKE